MRTGRGIRRGGCACQTRSKHRSAAAVLETVGASRTHRSEAISRCHSRTCTPTEEIIMPEITMPRLSDTMEERTIARWLKKPGDKVNKGDVLGEIETDKATMDLEAYETGVLEQILVQEGETVPIGQAIAVVGSGAGATQASATKHV